MKLNINSFANRPQSTSSNAYDKEPTAKSTQIPVHGSPLLSNSQEKNTSSSVHKGHAAFLANSTMQWKIGAALRKTSVTPPAQAGKNDQDIANALHIAAKENNAADIHDFAFSQLNNIPLNERFAWLRKLGADKAMYESMRQGSVETIEAWGEVVKLLPEGSRFAFLNEKIRDSNTEGKNGNDNFVTALASRITKQIAPTEVQITLKEWGLADHDTGTPVPIPEAVEKAGLAIAQDFTQRLLGKSSKLFFPDKKDNDDNATAGRKLRPIGKLDFKVSFENDKKESDKNGDRNSIATSIFSNTQPGAMKAWGKVLELVPDQNQERSKLLFSRMDHEKGTPALALLFERGEKQALDQFVDLAKQHVWHGDEGIHHVLSDCMPTLKKLAFEYKAMTGLEARDSEKRIGTKYAKANSLSRNSEEIVKAYGKLVQLAPKKHRNDILFPEDIWMTFTGKTGSHSALSDQLGHQQAQELARSITLLKAMAPTMTAEERKTILNEIRSRHATKVMGVWKNTHSYEKFKKEYPAVDAMLLDLKAELKKT